MTTKDDNLFEIKVIFEEVKKTLKDQSFYAESLFAGINCKRDILRGKIEKYTSATKESTSGDRLPDIRNIIRGLVEHLSC